MEAYKKRLIEERKQLLEHIDDISAAINEYEMLNERELNLLLLQRDAMRQYLNILTVRLHYMLTADESAKELGPVHYDYCAICHTPILIKGKSCIELSDTCGNTEHVEGLCQACYLKFYNAIKRHGRGLV